MASCVWRRSLPPTGHPGSLGGIEYAWTDDAATPGFSGSGYIEAYPVTDGTSTNTVATNWETTSPQANYTVTFSNAGTYYVWVRGFAGDASSAGVYVGLNGASPTNARIDMQQYNAWSWANTAAGSSTPVTLNIPSAGTYTFNLWMRDSWVDIDRILLTRNPNFSPAPDANFWRNQNIYQIITDRFFDGDSSNNNFYGGAEPATGNKTHGGDWVGVERKLDYIKSLGATAIWLSPVLKNANGDFDYHGYAATDFYNVDPRFGNPSKTCSDWSARPKSAACLSSTTLWSTTAVRGSIARCRVCQLCLSAQRLQPALQLRRPAIRAALRSGLHLFGLRKLEPRQHFPQQRHHAELV